MIARYTRPEMGRIWSDENKYRCWLKVELATTAALADAGIVPRKAANTLIENADFDLPRIQAIEAEVKHDVIAFTTAVAEEVGNTEASRWLHYGLTSNDVVDTAQALQIAEATLSRWETGAQIQQRSMDRLLRAFFDLEPLRTYYGITAPATNETAGQPVSP